MNYLIKKALEDDPVLKIGFERNLISATSLAKHIMNNNPGEDIKHESLRTAIRRLKRSKKESNLFHSAQDILAKSYLHVRSNMVKLEFKKDESTLHLINKSFKINEVYNNNDLFRLIKGHTVLHAIVEEINLDKIFDLFHGKIIRSHKGLSEFIIAMPFESRETPGVLLTLVNELSMNHINFVQAHSCGEEINIIVDGKDSQKCFNLLSNLFERCKINSGMVDNSSNIIEVEA